MADGVDVCKVGMAESQAQGFCVYSGCRRDSGQCVVVGDLEGTHTHAGCW